VDRRYRPFIGLDVLRRTSKAILWAVIERALPDKSARADIEKLTPHDFKIPGESPHTFCV
jgi:hypothetical protein